MTLHTDMTNSQKALIDRMVSLAEDCVSRGELAEAERLYREVLHFLHLVAAPDDANVRAVIERLLEVLDMTGKSGEALDLMKQFRLILRPPARDSAKAERTIKPESGDLTSPELKQAAS